MTRIFHWFFMWKMDPMSGFDNRVVFTLPPRDITLQYKRCIHLWNNFPCIITLSKTGSQKYGEVAWKLYLEQPCFSSLWEPRVFILCLLLKVSYSFFHTPQKYKKFYINKRDSKIWVCGKDRIPLYVSLYAHFFVYDQLYFFV